MLPAAAREVLDFWLGDAAGSDEAALNAASSRWFTGGAHVDAEIRERFGACIEDALAGGLSDWENDIRARLALVILLDQFPRNVFRRTARAFAGDARALQLVRDAVRDNHDKDLRPVERLFLLMPYQHAEDIDVQHEGVRLFKQLAEEPVTDAIGKVLRISLEYAERHSAIIARFGRFPYRNEVLGRDSTVEEERWLQESGERFGQ